LIQNETVVTVNDKHGQRLVRDMIVNSVELIHPDILTPSNSNDALAENIHA
jgi:hypothetical protein